MNIKPFLYSTLLIFPPLLFCLPASGQAESIATLLKLPTARHQNGFLPPDQAFKLSVLGRNSHQIIASFTPAPGYYLYRDRIKFALKNAGAGHTVTARMPPAEIKADPYFGRMAVYHHPFQVIIDLKRPKTLGGAVELSADYQGCSERGLCYQPISKVIPVKLPAGR